MTQGRMAIQKRGGRPHLVKSEERSDVAIQTALRHSCALLDCFAFGSQ
jgi:hypothetical protein